jgi:hypothetical protein
MTLNATEEMTLKQIFHDSLVGEIPLSGYSTVNQGWQMFALPAQPVVFFNPRYGKLVIGMHPSGKFDQWVFHEVNGGGVMTIGYHVANDGTIKVLMQAQSRFNLIGDMPDIETTSGGFQDDGTVALPEAIREQLEESQAVPNEMVQLPGRKFVGNRAFFFLDGENEGTDAFCFMLSDEQVREFESELMPWGYAVRNTRDALSGMVLARLRDYIDETSAS